MNLRRWNLIKSNKLVLSTQNTNQFCASLKFFITFKHIRKKKYQMISTWVDLMYRQRARRLQNYVFYITILFTLRNWIYNARTLYWIHQSEMDLENVSTYAMRDSFQYQRIDICYATKICKSIFLLLFYHCMSRAGCCARDCRLIRDLF